MAVTNLILIYHFRLTRALQLIAIFLFLSGVGLLIGYGKFNNEFLRITVTISSLAFTYYSYLHWMVRWLSIGLHVFIITVVET